MDERYSRQTILDEIGSDGQRKLLAARVLIVGAGGLGSPVSTYLVAAGIGHIGLVDDDSVSISNLQRQVLYSEEMVGLPKAVEAAHRLTSMNREVDVVPYVCRLEQNNIESVLKGWDIVVDCCDNYDTRVLVSQTCMSMGKVYIYGAIQGFEGQVSVFDSETIGYSDLFPEAPQNPSKAVIGMTAGVIGCVQAHEAVKIICGYGTVLRNKLWTIDLRSMESNIIELS